jgi:uncharacterized protein YbjT (DUF2867 family)
MSTVLVTGGTGVLGTVLAPELRRRGHEVRVLSRRAGAGTHLGDLASGAGVQAAADGAELAVHAASDSRRFGRADERQTEAVLDAVRSAGTVRHLLYVSIVGVDAIPFGYYRRKLACERLVAEGGVPWTILRATQFHELIAELLRRTGNLPVTPLPLDFQFQPVSAAEVATRIADLLDTPPSGRAPDMGGPEVRTLGQLTWMWRAARGRPRRIVNLRLPGRVAGGFRRGDNTCPDHADGTVPWAEFIAEREAPNS